MLALIVTKSGLPIGYKVFSGDTFDGHTILYALQDIQENYKIDNVVFVADSGMFNKNNLDEFDKVYKAFLFKYKEYQWNDKKRKYNLIDHLMSDHVHMLVSIPPKYSVAQIVGFIKGKSAISIARTYFWRKKNFTGQHFWARGYHVSTVGRDEAMIREYIRHQEAEDQRINQLALF